MSSHIVSATSRAAGRKKKYMYVCVCVVYVYLPHGSGCFSHYVLHRFCHFALAFVGLILYEGDDGPRLHNLLLRREPSLATDEPCRCDVLLGARSVCMCVCVCVCLCEWCVKCVHGVAVMFVCVACVCVLTV